MFSCEYSTVGHAICQRMPPKLRSKTTVESPDSGSDVVEATHEGKVSVLVE